MKRTDPALDEILGCLRDLFDAEMEAVGEVRALEASVDRTAGAQAHQTADLAAQLGRLEGLLGAVLDGQAELSARLDVLEAGRNDRGRLEDLVLRLVARLPLAGLPPEPADQNQQT